LRQGELSVGELASKLQLREANISQHLSLMRKHGILASRRDGLNIYYRLAQPKVIQAFDIMREVLLEQLAERAEMITQIQQEGLKSTKNKEQ
jgi:ArsR family transcriptional regulator